MNIRKIAREVIKLRPPDKPSITQYHIDCASLIRRVKKIVEYTTKKDSILFLGDDDFASLVLYRLGYNSLTVVDIDKEILEILSKKSKNSINTVHFDLRLIYRKKYPKLKQGFDFFVTDPPYTEDGLKIFSGVGIKNIKTGGKGMIVCQSKRTKVTRRSPEMLMRIVEEFVLRNGGIIIEIVPHSQRSYHGTISSMIVIKKEKPIKNIKWGELLGEKHFY